MANASARGPDALVEQHGQLVEHVYVTEYELDENGQVDESTVETESETVRAVISNPSEEDVQRSDGRLGVGSLKLTVPSDHDVQATRGGRRDRIHYPPRMGWGDGAWGEGAWGGRDPSHRVYQVVEVKHDEHPLTGTGKQTVFVTELGGR